MADAKPPGPAGTPTPCHGDFWVPMSPHARAGCTAERCRVLEEVLAEADAAEAALEAHRAVSMFPEPAAPVEAAPRESVPFVASRPELGAPGAFADDGDIGERVVIGVDPTGRMLVTEPAPPAADHPPPWRWKRLPNDDASILEDASGQTLISACIDDDSFASPSVRALTEAAPVLDQQVRDLLKVMEPLLAMTGSLWDFYGDKMGDIADDDEREQTLMNARSTFQCIWEDLFKR